MKIFWVFWTYEANYADKVVKQQARNLYEACVCAVPYPLDKVPSMRLIVFEEGGTLVYNDTWANFPKELTPDMVA